MSRNKSYHDTSMELMGCYSCQEVGGSFTEGIDGVVQCNNCGEHTVVSISHMLETFALLKELGLLDEYSELIETFGVLRFDDEDEFDMDDY